MISSIAVGLFIFGTILLYLGIKWKYEKPDGFVNSIVNKMASDGAFFFSIILFGVSIIVQIIKFIYIFLKGV